MTDMTGKVCLVTGATSGIGRATAQELARRGANVVLHGRSVERLDQTVAEIRNSGATGNLSCMEADLSSLAETRSLAAEVNALATPLHVLVCNAGVLTLRPHLSQDGFELQFAVNHLAHFLLTNLLLDKLKASGGARVVIVASRAHIGRRPDPNNFERNPGLFAYGRSKFANILFAKELARRLAGTDVTANALHPGVVWTNMVTGRTAPLSWFVPLLRPMLISPADGAKTSVYLASSPAVEGVSGKYFVECRETQPERATNDPVLAKRLWEKSAELVKLV